MMRPVILSSPAKTATGLAIFSARAGADSRATTTAPARATLIALFTARHALHLVIPAKAGIHCAIDPNIGSPFRPRAAAAGSGWSLPPTSIGGRSDGLP